MHAAKLQRHLPRPSNPLAFLHQLPRWPHHPKQRSVQCTSATRHDLFVLRVRPLVLIIHRNTLFTAFNPRAFSCTTEPESDGEDSVATSAGDWPAFSKVPGIGGVQDFDDLASSMICTRYDKW